MIQYTVFKMYYSMSVFFINFILNSVKWWSYTLTPKSWTQEKNELGFLSRFHLILFFYSKLFFQVRLFKAYFIVYSNLWRASHTLTLTKWLHAPLILWQSDTKRHFYSFVFHATNVFILTYLKPKRSDFYEIILQS